MNMEWDEKKWKEIFECMKSKRFNDLSKILITDPITEKQLEYLANYNITRFHNTEFMKLLIADFGFTPSDDFFKNHIMGIKPVMGKVFKEMMDINILDKMDDDAFGEYFFKAFLFSDIETMNEIIEYGYDINKISNKYKISMVLSDNSYYPYNFNQECLKFILDCGLKLDFIDEDTIRRLIKNKCNNEIKILIEYGVNFDFVNKIEIPKYFDNTYQLLLDAGIKPNTIAFLCCCSENY